MEKIDDPCITPFKMIEQNLGTPKCFPKGSMLRRIRAFVDFKVAFGFPDEFYYVKEGTVRPVILTWHRLQKLKETKNPTEEIKKEIDQLQYYVDNGVGIIKDAITNLAKECETELAQAKTTVNEVEESMKKLNIGEKKLPKDKREEYRDAKKAVTSGITPTEEAKRQVLQKTVSEKLQEIAPKIPLKNMPIGTPIETIKIPLTLTKQQYDRWVKYLCEGYQPKDSKAFAERIVTYIDNPLLEKEKVKEK